MTPTELHRLRVRAYVDGLPPTEPARPWRPGGRAVIIHRVGAFVGMAEIDEGRVVAEGIFARDPEDLPNLKRWARGKRPAVPAGLGAGGLIVGGVETFAKRLSNRCERLDVPLVGFNVPALVAGLSEHVAKSRGGGFSLALNGLRFEGRDGRRRDDADRARLRLMPRGGDGGAFFQWGKPWDDSAVKHKSKPRSFIDLRELAGALSNNDDPVEPATACSWFEIEWPTPAANPCRRLRGELAALVELYLATTTELHTVAPGLNPANTWSGGSIAGHLFGAAGVPRWGTKTADLPPSQVGAMAAAFRGGRTEARLVGVPVPAALVDITATYPATFSLLNLTRFLPVARVDSEDVTDELRDFLTAPDLLDRLYQRSTWQRWDATFARVRPRGEVLPSTVEWAPARVGGTVAPLDLAGGTIPLHWADLAAGAVEGRTVPEIVEAWRLVPGELAEGIRSLRMPSGAKVNLATDDLGAAFLAERDRWRADASPAGRRRLEMAKGIYVAATFGQLARVDPGRRRGAAGPLGPDGEQLHTTSGRSERAGPWCAFPLAASVCAGARLLVALGVRGVADFGGVVAHISTDSLLIPASPDGGAVRCPGAPGDEMRLLTWAQVRFVVERFETLGVRWKSENGTLDEPTTALVVGVNKIILGREDSAGVLQVVRSNDTDLGWIVDPTGTGAHLPDGRAAWIAEVEGAILRAAVEHGSGSSLVRGDLADWCGRPALRQFTPTTWPDLKAARAALGDPALRPYARLLRASGGATGSGPVAVDNGSGPDSWAKLDWWWRGQQVSLFTLDALGTILPLGGSGLLRVHIDTVADHLARWLRENDPSMAGPERGLRQPVPVCSGPGLIGVFGKDGGRMAAQDDDHDATDQLRYGAPLGELRTAVQAVGVPVVAKASGLGARTLQRYLDGTRTPDRETVARVASAVAELVDTARAGQCPGPGCTITLRPKQHYCSSSCRNAAWRAAQVAGAAS